MKDITMSSVSLKGKDYYLILQRTEKGQASVLGEVKIETEKPVTLQVTANGDDYRFNYSIDGKGFLNLEEPFPAIFFLLMRLVALQEQ